MEVRATLLFCLALEGTPSGLLASKGPKHDAAWGCGVASCPELPVGSGKRSLSQNLCCLVFEVEVVGVECGVNRTTSEGYPLSAHSGPGV